MSRIFKTTFRKLFFILLILTVSTSVAYSQFPNTVSAQDCGNKQDNDPNCQTNFTATCTIIAADTGDDIEISWGVDMSPRTSDYDQVNASAYMYIDAPGSQPIYLGTSTGDGGAGGEYTVHKIDSAIGSYTATVFGNVFAFGAEQDNCTNSVTFNISHDGGGTGVGDPGTCSDPEASNYNQTGSCIFVGCTDSNASNYWSKANQDDGSCVYPGDSDPNGSNPPADFSINGQCDLWPNPEVEISFSPVSGATNYKLQKWHIYYYYDLYSGTYDYVNRRTDPVEDGETAYYRVVAENDNGSTSSNEYEQVVNQANCGGGAIALTTSVSAGSGSISGTGISCPGDCSEYFDYGDWVTLTATPASGYAFSGWTGACAGQGASCSVYMDSSKSTAVSFSSNSYTLSVAKAGSGGGSIGSDPGGIGCGPTCSAAFSYGTSVALYVSPQTGTDFSGWSGACSGTSNPCTVSMTSDKSVTANFSASNYTLTLTKTGSGFGSVGSDPGGIGCGPTCSAIFSYGTVVSLYPTAQTDSDFTGWSGACAGAGLGVCNLSISGNMEAVANFDATPFNYSLSNSGTSSVTKSSGNAYTQNVIDKNLISGSAQSVSLSLSGVPDGVSYSIADSTCAPNCSSTITFTVSPSAPTGSYTITVTGSPLNKTTSFTLSITGSPITVSCSASPTTALLGEPVLWSASVVGGVAPLSYSWSGTNFPTPAPDSATYSKTYTTVGQKVAQLTVTDDNGTSATCPAVTIQINFNPDFTEF